MFVADSENHEKQPETGSVGATADNPFGNILLTILKVRFFNRDKYDTRESGG